MLASTFAHRITTTTTLLLAVVVCVLQSAVAAGVAGSADAFRPEGWMVPDSRHDIEPILLTDWAPAGKVTPTYLPSVLVANGSVFVVGGFSHVNFTEPSKTIERFDVASTPSSMSIRSDYILPHHSRTAKQNGESNAAEEEFPTVAARGTQEPWTLPPLSVGIAGRTAAVVKKQRIFVMGMCAILPGFVDISTMTEAELRRYKTVEIIEAQARRTIVFDATRPRVNATCVSWEDPRNNVDVIYIMGGAFLDDPSLLPVDRIDAFNYATETFDVASGFLPNALLHPAVAVTSASIFVGGGLNFEGVVPPFIYELFPLGDVRFCTRKRELDAATFNPQDGLDLQLVSSAGWLQVITDHGRHFATVYVRTGFDNPLWNVTTIEDMTPRNGSTIAAMPEWRPGQSADVTTSLYRFGGVAWVAHEEPIPPTPNPTAAPTPAPTPEPSASPTAAPTSAPTLASSSSSSSVASASSNTSSGQSGSGSSNNSSSGNTESSSSNSKSQNAGTDSESSASSPHANSQGSESSSSGASSSPSSHSGGRTANSDVSSDDDDDSSASTAAAAPGPPPTGRQLQQVTIRKPPALTSAEPRTHLALANENRQLSKTDEEHHNTIPTTALLGRQMVAAARERTVIEAEVVGNVSVMRTNMRLPGPKLNHSTLSFVGSVIAVDLSANPTKDGTHGCMSEQFTSCRVRVSLDPMCHSLVVDSLWYGQSLNLDLPASFVITNQPLWLCFSFGDPPAYCYINGEQGPPMPSPFYPLNLFFPLRRWKPKTEPPTPTPSPSSPSNTSKEIKEILLAVVFSAAVIIGALIVVVVVLRRKMQSKNAEAVTQDTRYVELGPIGEGAFGKVLRVRRVVDDAIFAKKHIECPSSDVLHEALKEFELLRTLQAHPNIIRVVDMFLNYEIEPLAPEKRDSSFATEAPLLTRQQREHAKRDKEREQRPTRHLCIVMDYHPLGDLKNWVLSRPDRVPEPILCHIAVQTCSVLAFIHHKGILHRDLKPENILLVGPPPAATFSPVSSPMSPSFRDSRSMSSMRSETSAATTGNHCHQPIVVTDFGLAHLYSERHRSRAFVGTAVYSAPEAVAILEYNKRLQSSPGPGATPALSGGNRDGNRTPEPEGRSNRSVFRLQRSPRREESKHVRQRSADLDNEAGVTSQSDMWSLGCVLYTIATKRLERVHMRKMFEDVHKPGFDHEIRHELTAQCGYSIAYANFVLRLLRVRPAERPTAKLAIKFFRKNQRDNSYHLTEKPKLLPGETMPDAVARALDVDDGMHVSNATAGSGRSVRSVRSSGGGGGGGEGQHPPPPQQLERRNSARTPSSHTPPPPPPIAECAEEEELTTRGPEATALCINDDRN